MDTTASDTLARWRDVLRDPDWDAYDVGDVRWCLPKLIAVAEAALAASIRIDTSGFPLGRCDAQAVVLRAALMALGNSGGP